MLTSFFVRKLFIYEFGLEILGIDYSFSNAISLLSVAELGLGTGMIYKLYKPVAEKNHQKTASILKFLRNSYLLISGILLLFGIVFSFFTSNLIKENFDKIWLTRIFILYIFDTLASYLFFYKRVMFIADQKSYLNNLIKIFVIIVSFISQILVIRFLRSLEIYLITKIIFRLLENILISYFFDKQYNFLNIKSSHNFDKLEKKEITKSISSMFFHRISGTGIKQISGIIIPAFATLRENGIYSNYMMIITALWGISNEFFGGMAASFGNLLHTESKEKIHKNFNMLFFINFLIYSFFVSAFFGIITPFMKIWIRSENSVFSIYTIILITIYLYVYGMKQCVEMAKISAGIYTQDKFMPIIEFVINLTTSFLMTKYYGINGAIFGATISAILVPLISQPYFFYKLILKISPIEYYRKYFIYACISTICILITNTLIGLVHLNSFILQIAFNLSICLLIPMLLNLLIFRKTEEFIKIKNHLILLKNKLKYIKQ
jgi:hypothetical protein